MNSGQDEGVSAIQTDLGLQVERLKEQYTQLWTEEHDHQMTAREDKLNPIKCI